MHHYYFTCAVVWAQKRFHVIYIPGARDVFMFGAWKRRCSAKEANGHNFNKRARHRCADGEKLFCLMKEEMRSTGKAFGKWKPEAGEIKCWNVQVCNFLRN